MGGYKVTAPLVIAHDNLGKLHYHYRHPHHDTVIPWLRDDEAEHFQNLGLVEKVADDAAAAPAASWAAYGVQPKKTAPVAEWVDYAAARGADRTEAESLTKQELIELYGDR